ncbi:MAG TPA: hypothetical protein VGC21_08885 [Telluria sp.]|jgi:hypothetical protein
MKTKMLLLPALLAVLLGHPLAALADAPLALHFDDSGEAAERAGTAHVVRERVVMNMDQASAQPFDHAALTGPLMISHGRIVKNAPYSAEVVSEQLTNLADGNQIANKSSSMSYRDSAGRTRQERRNANGDVTLVTIRDGAAGATWFLRPEAKTATRLVQPDQVAHIAAEKARAAAEKARASGEIARAAGERARAAAEKARVRAQALHGAEGDQVFVKRIERSAGVDGQRIGEDVRIRVSRELAERQPMPGADRFGPLIAGAFGDMKWSTKASTKDLGTKEIDGVRAQGKLRSYEIPAGEIGNRNAIVVTTETWYSPDLQVTLLSKHSDPRSGERTYRLANLKRDEPAAGLFTVPPDYTVKDPLGNARKVDAQK